ncbi:MAG: serine hydroxymethyltransferase, partial [Oscillospiraceae bacterium]|nr:serine hydroxymethyltransferase [Oscillospiraceae bacterium]
VSGGTDNHLMLMDLRDNSISGRVLEERLDSVRITANKNMIPDDPGGAKETSGLRLGTPAVTTRGFNEDDCSQVGELIYMAVTDFDSKKEEIISRVDELCKRYPIYA